MSKSRMINLECEKCGKEYSFEKLESVNVTLTPELKEKVFNGDIYKVRCPHCGHETYFPYPFIYQDMDMGYMIDSGSIYDLYSNKKSYENVQGQLKEIVKTIKHYGVESYFDLLERILELDEGLDVTLCTFKKMVFREMFMQEREKDIEEGRIESIRTSIEKSNKGDLEIVISFRSVEHPDDIVSTNIKLNDPIFDSFIDEKTKERLSFIDPYVLNEDYVKHIVLLKDEVYEQKKNESLVFALCDVDNHYVIAAIPSFNTNNFKEGDYVCIRSVDEKTKEGLITGKIHKLFKHDGLNYFTFLNNFPIVSYKPVDQIHLKGEESDKELDNEVLKVALKGYEKFKIMPYPVLKQSKLIIGSTISASISEEDLIQLLKKDIVTGEEMNKLHPVIKFLCEEKDGRSYLSLYVNQTDVPNVDGLSKEVYPFDSILRLYFNRPGKYNGICIISSGEKIFLSNYELLNYAVERVTKQSDEFVNFLKTLSKEEDSYIIEKLAHILKDVYVNKEEIPQKTLESLLERTQPKIRDIILSRLGKEE